MLALRPQEPREEGGIGELVRVGVREFLVDHRRGLREVEAPEQQLDVIVPASAGTVSVVVTVGPQSSQAAPFTILPHVASLDPGSGPPGQVVTGTAFGSAGSVTVNGLAAGILTWTGTSISAQVPAGATSGPVVVTTAASHQNANPPGFTVTVVPQGSAILPASGVVDQAVVLTGASFGAATGTVRFNGPSGPDAEILDWSDTRVEVRVPVGLPLGALPSRSPDRRLPWSPPWKP